MCMQLQPKNTHIVYGMSIVSGLEIFGTFSYCQAMIMTVTNSLAWGKLHEKIFARPFPPGWWPPEAMLLVLELLHFQAMLCFAVPLFCHKMLLLLLDFQSSNFVFYMCIGGQTVGTFGHTFGSRWMYISNQTNWLECQKVQDEACFVCHWWSSR